jgi:hypothetical protein
LYGLRLETSQRRRLHPAFKQYVGIYTKNKPKHQVILQQPKVKQLGDRAFLVGTPVEYASNFVEKPNSRLTPEKEVIRWIALSEVVEMYEFDDIKGYQIDRE